MYNSAHTFHELISAFRTFKTYLQSYSLVISRSGILLIEIERLAGDKKVASTIVQGGGALLRRIIASRRFVNKGRSRSSRVRVTAKAREGDRRIGLGRDSKETDQEFSTSA